MRSTKYPTVSTITARHSQSKVFIRFLSKRRCCRGEPAEDRLNRCFLIACHILPCACLARKCLLWYIARMEEKETVNIRITRKAHRRLKVKAAEDGVTLMEVVEALSSA